MNLEQDGKALDMFLAETYNEDEDIELLTLLALLADPNNETVRKAAVNNSFFEGIYNDANRFSQDKGVQKMLFEEELAILDYNTSIHIAQEKGEEIGINTINKLYEWLLENDRQTDVLRAIKDPVYRKSLLDEYTKEKV